MFSYLKQIVFGKSETNELKKLKLGLSTLIVRKRYLKTRNATIEIQNFYRYHKNRKIVNESLKKEGHRLQEIAYNLKQRYLMKLRSDLSKALIIVDSKL